MPCNCDYMEPNEREINHAKIIALIEELDTNILPKYFYNTTASKVYNNTNNEKFNNDGRILCSRLKNVNVNNYSLEMQIWWRDHQKADEIRLKKEEDEKQNKLIRLNALNKLTNAEKISLGINLN